MRRQTIKEEILKELITLTNEVIELNKKLFAICTRLHILIEEEEEKNKEGQKNGNMGTS